MKINFFNISIFALVSALVMSCGYTPKNGAAFIPQRDYINPTYTPSTADETPSLPPGTTPEQMKISNLSPEEVQNAQVVVSVGKIRSFTVDILLNTKQTLRGYSGVKWSVSNPDIGTINSKGVFTPLKEGKTKIIASINGVAAQIEISITSALNVWSQVISPTSSNLYSAKLVNDNEGWAVGQGGTILHYSNGGWMDETGSVSSSLGTSGTDLMGVDALESGDAWAVGGNIILHNSGGKWEKDRYTPDGNLKAIDMLNPTDGWAVGSTSGNKGMVLHFTNGTWQDVGADIKEELNSVSVVGPNEVWVAGKSKLLGAPAVYKFNGEKWTKARFNQDTFLSNLLSKVTPWDGTYEVKAIKMLNSSQGWIVGESSPIASSIRGQRGFMFYYDSIKDIWVRGSFDKATANLEQVPLKNVGMISGGKGWVLGTNTPPKSLLKKDLSDIPGNFLECNGKELKIDTKYQANTVGKSFYGIDLLPNGNGVVVGENGFIMHHQYDVSRPNYYSSGNNYNNNTNYANSTNTNPYGGYNTGGTTGTGY